VVGGSVSGLLGRAREGDQRAWDDLVDRFAGLVWGIARAYRLDQAAAADVSQTVWLRVVENLDRIREPEAFAGWLATAARRESLRAVRAAGRELPRDDVAEADLADVATVDPTPDAVVERQAQRDLVWQALAQLSHRCQLLLRALAGSPDASYADVAAALGLPIGSIGPTRGRCLQHLRRELARVDAIDEPAAGDARRRDAAD
jgi:RNA polymerase sigma factor (sigma-70 family)